MRRGVLLGLVLVLAAALFASPTEQASAQSTQVLVSNLGQANGGSGGMTNDHAQAFTTGGDSAGYILTSVDMQFRHLSDTSFFTTRGATVSIRSDSTGNPGTVLGTLTAPSFSRFTSDQTLNFAASGAGIDLEANTKYWVVLDVDQNPAGNNSVRNTASDNEDSSSAPGFSIANDGHYRSFGSNTDSWTSFHQARKIRINGVPRITANADGSYTVPQNWALTPSGLNPGDKFRLLFQTRARRDATDTDIAVYDTFVQTQAAAGHTAIQPYSSLFKVVGSTASVDARDHTSTTGTGHPIYWLNGLRVAANYAGFWSDNWENWANTDKRFEDGTQGDSDWHWTGTDEDGTKHSNPLGNTGPNVRRGQFSTGGSSRNPISHWDTPKAEEHSFYALSPVFVVPQQPHLTITAPQGEQRAGAEFDIEVIGGVPAPTGNPVRVEVKYSRTVIAPTSGRNLGWFYMGFTPGNWDTQQTISFQPTGAVQRTFTTYVTFESYELIQRSDGRRCANAKDESDADAELRGACWDAYSTIKGHVHTQRVPIVVGPKNPRIVSSDVSITYQGGVNCFDAEREWTHIECIWLYEGEGDKFNYASHSDGYAEGNRSSALLGRTGRTTVENQAFTYTISIPKKPGPDQTFTVKPVVDGSGVTLSHDGTEDAQGAIILSPDDYSVTVKVVPNDDLDVANDGFTIKHTLGGSFGYDSLFHQGGYLWITGEVLDDDRVAKAPIFKDADGNEINAGNPLRLPTRAAANNTAEYYFTVELPHPLASMVTVRTSATFTPYRASDGRILYRSLRAHEPIHLATGAFDPKYPDHYVWVHFGRDYELDAVARINVRKSSTITATDGETDVLYWSIRNAYASHTSGTIPIVYDSSLLPTPFIASSPPPEDQQAPMALASDDPLVKYAGLIANVYGYITDHFDDEVDIEWKRVLKAFQHEEYQDYPYDAATAADARQRYTDTQDPRWAPIGDALAYVESYTPPAALKQAVTPEPPLEKYADLITRIKTDVQDPHYGNEPYDLKRVLRDLGVPEYKDAPGPAVSVQEATNRRTLPNDNPHWEGIADAIQYKLDYDAGTLAPPTTPVITISGGSGITEGGSATFTITANPAPSSPITVNVGVSESGSFGASGPATISVSGASTSYTVTTSDDDVDEADGSVTATVQAGAGYTVGGASSASVTVADNDDPAPTLIHTCQPKRTGNNASLTDTPLTITETGGVRTLRIPENGKYVCLKLDNPGGSGRQIWRSDVFTIGGEEAVRVEWTEDNKVSFIYARFLDDNAYTGDRETATVRLAGGSKQWKAVIVDDETGVTPPPPPPATPVITISGGSGITEGGTASFTISANPAPASPITVNVGVSESGNWGASGASAVTISAATTTYTIATSNDNVDEANGSVTATIQSGTGYTVGSPSSASVNVADNDDPPPATPVITVSGGSSITEGGTATFTITANPAPASPITVNIGVSESGSWGASGPTTVTVSGGTTTYTVSTTNDNVDEPNGSVTAAVQSGNGYTVGSPSSASVSVADNDDTPPPPPATPVITISGGAGITEGGSASFTITASPAPASPITVNIGVSESGSWGASGPTTVTVSGGTTTYTVSTSDDDVDEPNGSVTVRVQSGVGYSAGSPASAAVSVSDNDDPPEVRAERTQLTAQVTALRDKYAKLQHNSLTHRGLYLRIEEVLKALKGQPSSLDTGWLAPSYMRGAINTVTGFGDTQAAEVLAEARDFLGIRVLN